MSEIAVISKEDLSLVENNSLNGKQLQLIMQGTPAKYIKKRPGKGGGQWSYVSGTYVRKVLNLMFGWDWDFEVVSELIEHGEVIVKGKLTARANGKSITKMQFGNKDIAYKKGTKDPLSIGNDMKAAATDALKKCAFELGIAQDVYSPDEFTRLNVEEITIEKLTERFNENKESISVEDQLHIERIIENKETQNYNKAWKTIK